MAEFESRAASEIIEVPERMFRYWATTRAFIPKEDAVGRQGLRRKYSPKNLVEAAVIRDLVKLNVSVPQAAAAVSRLQDKNFMEASFCLLIISANGKIEVITENEIMAGKGKRRMAIENPNKQLAGVVGNDDDLDPPELYQYVFSKIVTMDSAVLVPVHKVRAEVERKAAHR